jgi:hypothetical protein
VKVNHLHGRGALERKDGDQCLYHPRVVGYQGKDDAVEIASFLLKVLFDVVHRKGIIHHVVSRAGPG